MRFRVNSPAVIHETIDDEVVVIDLTTGCYYSLAGTGCEFWQLIDLGWTQDNVVALLTDRYHASPVEADACRLIAELLDEGLIAKDEDGQQRTGEVRQHRAVWETPELQKFDDMQDLILLDPVHEVDEEKGWPHIKAAPPR